MMNGDIMTKEDKEKLLNHVVGNMMYEIQTLRDLYPIDVEIIVTISMELYNLLVCFDYSGRLFSFERLKPIRFEGYETHVVVSDGIWYSVGVKNKFD